jgi:hypothetical protein
MTLWEQYILSLGIKKGGKEKKGHKISTRPKLLGYRVGSGELSARPIMVPMLFSKTLMLGYLPPKP